MKKMAEEILNAIGDGIIQWDGEGSSLIRNESASEMWATMPEAWHARCRQMLAQAARTGERIAETLTSQEGVYNLIATPLAQGALLIMQDKTSEDRVMEKEKEFVVYAAHELRTPFAVVRGFAETLYDFPDLPKKMRQEIVGKIVHTCTRLDRTLQSLLTLADVEALTEERLTLLNLVTLVEEGMALFSTMHPAVQVTFVPSFPQKGLWVRGDRELLALALSNILENGVRYSIAPAQLEIALKQEAQSACIVVTDRGIGIPESDLSRIFQRFYTVDKERSRKSGGAGLGLSIVQTVLTKHHGSVDVVSTLGKGSSFTLRLPLSVS